MNKLLGMPLNNIRIVIGKYEIYPNTMLVRMDDQDICDIKLKTRMFGGMNHRGIKH